MMHIYFYLTVVVIFRIHTRPPMWATNQTCTTCACSPRTSKFVVCMCFVAYKGYFAIKENNLMCVACFCVNGRAEFVFLIVSFYRASSFSFAMRDPLFLVLSLFLCILKWSLLLHCVSSQVCDSRHRWIVGLFIGSRSRGHCCVLHACRAGRRSHYVHILFLLWFVFSPSTHTHGAHWQGEIRAPGSRAVGQQSLGNRCRRERDDPGTIKNTADWSQAALNSWWHHSCCDVLLKLKNKKADVKWLDALFAWVFSFISKS